MTGLSDMKWEETDTDISTSDSTQDMTLRSCNGSSMDAISKKDLQRMTGMSARMDTLYQARILWTSEDVDLQDYVITNKEYSSCWIDKMTDKSLCGSTVLEMLVKAFLPDGSLREEERITCHLQLTTSNRSSNGYALAIKTNHTSLSTSLEVPSGINRFTLASKLSKTALCTILDIRLNCATSGDAKYWYSQTQDQI